MALKMIPTYANFSIQESDGADATFSLSDGPSAIVIEGVCTFDLTDGSITFNEKFDGNPDAAAKAFIERVKELGLR